VTKSTKLFGIVALCMLAFSSPMVYAQEKPRYGGTFTVAYREGPVNWNGILQFWTGTGGDIQRNIASRLVNFDKDYNIIPDLAYSWKQSSDYKTTTFNLLRNVTWHDGKPFTAADVKYTFEEMIRQNSITAAIYRNAGLKSIQTPDDYTVVFNFENPLALDEFADPHRDVFVLPKHLYEGKDFTTNPANLAPVGTGPWKLVEWKPKQYAIFEPNLAYFRPQGYRWGGLPYLDRLVMKELPRYEGQLLALEKGEVDFIEGIPLAEVPRIRKDPRLAIMPFLSTTVWRVTFNFKEETMAKYPFLKDVRVREAMARAIDRQTIVEKVMAGVTEPCYTPISKKVPWAYSPEAETKQKFDRALAEKLLDEAGYKKKEDGYRFTVEMLVETTAFDVSEALKEMWKLVGIKCDLSAVETTEFIGYEHAPEGLGKYPLALGRMGGGPNPNIMTGWMYSDRKTGTENWGFFKNTKVDELLDKARYLIDRTERAPLYKQAQQLANEDVGWIFLWNSYATRVRSRDFAGFDEWGMIYHTAYIPMSTVWWLKGSDVSAEGAMKAISGAEAKLKDLKTQGYDTAAAETKLQAAKDAYTKKDYTGAVKLAGEVVQAAVPPPPYAMYAGIVAVVAIVIGVYIYSKRKKKT